MCMILIVYFICLYHFWKTCHYKTAAIKIIRGLGRKLLRTPTPFNFIIHGYFLVSLGISWDTCGILGKRCSEPENKNDHNLILRVNQCLQFTTGKFSFLVVDRSQKYLSRPYVILWRVGGLALPRCFF